jgi:Holliday junction resolvase
MTGTAYRRGDHFEKRVADQLRIDGYIVYQSRGSKSPVDIVALKPMQVLLIQAKSGDTGLTGVEWNLLLELARRAGAIPLVADRTGPAGRVIRWRRITGPHPAHTRTWPCEDWTPDQVAAT